MLSFGFVQKTAGPLQKVINSRSNMVNSFLFKFCQNVTNVNDIANLRSQKENSSEILAHRPYQNIKRFFCLFVYLLACLLARLLASACTYIFSFTHSH